MTACGATGGSACSMHTRAHVSTICYVSCSESTTADALFSHTIYNQLDTSECNALINKRSVHRS